MNKESITKCLEYSENPEALEKLLNGDILIEITEIGTSKHFDDKEMYELLVEIIRGEKNYSFSFWESINTNLIMTGKKIKKTEKKKKFIEWRIKREKVKNELEKKGFKVKEYGETLLWEEIEYYSGNELSAMQKECRNSFLYSVLACIRSEYYCPNSFKDFCNEYGYDDDSITALKTYNKCRPHSQELQRIFTENEIECFPN